jgi:fumarate hydratase subunit beta
MNELSININAYDAASLRPGDIAVVSGVLHTARDAAHKRFLTDGIPFETKGAAVFYAGPAAAPPGAVVGSIGATTSTRMDAYMDFMLKEGVRTFIGKGSRTPAATQATLNAGAVYLVGIGGAAALTRRHVTACTLIKYPDLLAEAVYRLEVKDLPLVVVTCPRGTLYETK